MSQGAGALAAALGSEPPHGVRNAGQVACHPRPLRLLPRQDSAAITQDYHHRADNAPNGNNGKENQDDDDWPGHLWNTSDIHFTAVGPACRGLGRDGLQECLRYPSPGGLRRDSAKVWTG